MSSRNRPPKPTPHRPPDPPAGPGDPEALGRFGQGRRAALGAVAASIFLVAFKLAAAGLTGSLAILSAALDSLLDLFVSAANYLVLRSSVQPPDHEHTYGHGKYESFASLVQGGILCVVAVGLIVVGVDRAASGEVPRRTGVGIAVLAVSALVGFGVAGWLRAAGRATGSPALLADSLHYRTDLWVNLGALGALVVVRLTGWSLVDPLVAGVVALVVLKTGAGLVLDSFGELTDRALPLADLETVDRIVASFAPRVLGYHDLRSRRSGRWSFIELHLEIPADTSFVDAHDVMVEVLEAIEREVPRSKVFVHGDPVGSPDISGSSRSFRS